MKRIWISDFRGQLLERCLLENEPDATSSNRFIIDVNANINWLNNLQEKVSSATEQDAEVILILGLDACIASCTWSALSIEDIAEDYAAKIKYWSTNFPNSTFYACSVLPVECDCPCADLTGNMLSKEKVNKAIETFNSILSNSLSASYLDCNTYLSSFDPITYDGLRYTEDTCNSILSYIDAMRSSSVYLEESVDITKFKPRTAAPYIEDNGDSSIKYWRSIHNGGLNPFPQPGVYARIAGDTLPNCTAWAWGRFYEIIGEEPKLSWNNAEFWFLKDGAHGYGDDGYERGSIPLPGAVMCWQKGPIGSPGAGHVAIVEDVYSDGSILISESGWQRKAYWWPSRRYKGADGNWGQSSAYTFQGFIYPPSKITITEQVTKDMIRLENSKEAHHDEENQKISARYIWQYFSARGWTMNAVAAMLGNMSVESGINPVTWQSWTDYGNPNLRPDGVTDITYINYAEVAKLEAALGSVGYGLVQWTPYTNYFNWCNDAEKNGTGKKLPFWDIDSQLYRIEREVISNPSVQWALYYKNNGYTYKGESFDTIGKSFKTFTQSTKDPDWLAAAFAMCYERPWASNPEHEDTPGSTKNRDSLCATRGKLGTKWYNYLQNLSTTAQTTVITSTKASLKDLRICSRTSTSVTLSFLGGGSSASYFIEELKKSDNITLNSMNTFNITGLEPNKTYTVTVSIQDVQKNKIVDSITISTLPAPPNSITSLALDKDSLKDLFILTTVPLTDTDWGYWKKNSYGYIIQLIVNGKVKKENNVNTISKTMTFSLKDYFKYEPKLGDNIQIGIRTWVHDGNQYVYDDCFAKTSNAIYWSADQFDIFIN